VFARNAYAVEADISSAIKVALTDPTLPLLKRNIGQVSHLLNKCTTPNEVAGVLHRVIFPQHDLSTICFSIEQELSRPCLTSWHPFPSLRDMQLLRTLNGHTAGVNGCAISPDGSYIVSASGDTTLKLWDVRTGAERLTLRGHTDRVHGCAISPDGSYIVSASYDNTLKLWDALTGVCLDTLFADGYFLACAFHPDVIRLDAVGELGIFFLQLLRSQVAATRPIPRPSSRGKELPINRPPDMGLSTAARLELASTSGMARSIEIQSEMTIGRSHECDIFLEDLAVSRLHATIHLLPDGGYELEDHRSATGTFVNGMRVTRYHLLNGDVVQIGSNQLIFRLSLL